MKMCKYIYYIYILGWEGLFCLVWKEKLSVLTVLMLELSCVSNNIYQISEEFCFLVMLLDKYDNIYKYIYIFITY
jgi:hypothetical protein